ncbi:MAG: AAA family ATPase [Gammaproteobacteria bacterium]|nr:AAA family ATPase [Gammaproteobacteria bacterium]
MSLRFIEGAAGTGKTTELFGQLERELSQTPLGELEHVLALTKMHGSRRRMEERLRSIGGLRGRYRCWTADSFAWRIVRRWRSLARRTSTQELGEEDYAQVCSLAGDLLSDPNVAEWVRRTFPIVVVDEFQDCKGGQVAMLASLAEFCTCIVAGDVYLDLEELGVNQAIAWARENGEITSLSGNHRTLVPKLLSASQAIRAGQEVPENGGGFTALPAHNHNVGASFVSRNLTWWRGAADIAVLTPSRCPFVRDLLARVAEREFPNKHGGFGPHKIPWEESQEEAREGFIERLGLPADGTEVSVDDLSLDDAGGPMDGLRGWFEKQARLAGRTGFTSEEIRLEAHRIHQRSRAYRRVKNGGVRAMTIHQAKNREFHSVIVLWPYKVAGDDERRRRLLYNAISRARQQVLVVVQGPRRLQEPPFVATARSSPASRTLF